MGAGVLNPRVHALAPTPTLTNSYLAGTSNLDAAWTSTPPHYS
jgi:hypothetical protein